jgi:hypothetical protein
MQIWRRVSISALASAKLDHILPSEEVERYDGLVISELCWWLDTWHRRGSEWSLRREGPHAKPIFQAIEDAVQPHL